MKITIYTVSDCQFSKQEKEYLQSHNLPFEEKNLEQNREWLTEMLSVSNNFAGTPVTKIEKDDGQIIVLKGFTKEEFDQTLGIKEEVVQTETQPTPAQPQENPSVQTPQTKPAESTQISSPPPESNLPQAAEKTDEALNSILADLQEKVNAQPNQPPTNQTVNPNSQTPQSSTPGSLPNIPDFNDQNSNT